MDAPRQKLMNERATVVATTTFVVDDWLEKEEAMFARNYPRAYSTIKAMTSTTEETARAIALKLRARGWVAFLVGGCVRDLLLGLDPKDFDLSTDAPPDQVMGLFPGAVLVGAHFGVVLVDGVEVATFRSESAYGDGRHPDQVTFETDPAKDVLRRDFTINALMLDPLMLEPLMSDPLQNTSQANIAGPPTPLAPSRIETIPLPPRLDPADVIDRVGGIADLNHGIVRAIGDPLRRFEEDHLRMLRAVRFAARFRFRIHPSTLEAIQSLAPMIQRTAAERIRDELVRILTEGGARYGFELLDRTGLLNQILPEVAAMKGVAQPPEFHPEGDVWVHTLIMLDGLRAPSAALAMGVLLHDVGKPPTFRIADRIRFDGHVEAGLQLGEEILKRLRFSHEDASQALALIAHHMRFGEVRRMKESTVKRFLRLPRFEDHLELHRLDCSSSHGGLDNYRFMRERFERATPEDVRPPRLLTGAHLIAAGYQPGPAFAKILESVEDAQLEGRVTTVEQALELAKSVHNDLQKSQTL